MRYLLLSIICFSMNALSAGNTVSKPDAPVTPPATATQTSQDQFLMPGELNQYEDDDVVDQPDYKSEDERIIDPFPTPTQAQVPVK